MPDTTTLTVTVQTTEYAVTAFPLEAPDASSFTLKVTYRGTGRWAIIRLGECWNKETKSWDYESLPSNREDDWLISHRYDSAEAAIADAKEIAPFLSVNGWTVEQAIRINNGEALCGGLVTRGIRCSRAPEHEGIHQS